MRLPLLLGTAFFSAFAHPGVALVLFFLAMDPQLQLTRKVGVNETQAHFLPMLGLCLLALGMRWLATRAVYVRFGQDVKLSAPAFLTPQLAYLPAAPLSLYALFGAVEGNIAGFIVVPGLIILSAAAIPVELLLLTAGHPAFGKHWPRLARLLLKAGYVAIGLEMALPLVALFIL